MDTKTRTVKKKLVGQTKFDEYFPEIPTSKHSDMWFCRNDSTIQHVVEILQRHKIFGLPVISSSEKICDVIDWFDICSYALAVANTIEGKHPKNFGELFSSNFYSLKVSEVLERRPSWKKFTPLSRQASFMDVLHVLGTHGTYRAVIVSLFRRRITRFITQSDALKYVHDNIKDFGEHVIHKTIEETRIGLGRVACISEKAQVFDAFNKLMAKRTQGVGVVNSEGILVGCVSVRDLRRVLTKDVEDSFSGSVGELLKVIRADSAKYATPLEAITCTKQNDIQRIIWKLHTNRIHRVFIVDETYHAIGVITATDIFRYLAHPEKSYKREIDIFDDCEVSDEVTYPIHIPSGLSTSENQLEVKRVELVRKIYAENLNLPYCECNPIPSKYGYNKAKDELVNPLEKPIYSDNENSEQQEPVICVYESTQALEAFKLLVNKNILSAPVLSGSPPQEKTNVLCLTTSGSPTVVGILDLKDFCSYIVNDFWNTVGKSEEDTFDYSCSYKLSQLTAKDIMSLSKSTVYAPLNSNATIRKVLETLGIPGVQRIPIFNANKLLRLVTQSELIDFISTNAEIFGDIVDRTVSEMGFDKIDTDNLTHVTAVKQNAQMLWAFKALVQNKASSVAVLDAKNNLIGVITVRDMRKILSRDLENVLKLEDYTLKLSHNFPPNFSPKRILTQEVGEFLREKNTDKRYEAPTEPLVCRPSDTLQQIIWKLSHNRIHRLYVVNDDEESENQSEKDSEPENGSIDLQKKIGQPIGVITLGDLCAYLAQAKPDKGVHKKKVLSFAQRVVNILNLKTFDY